MKLSRCDGAVEALRLVDDDPGLLCVFAREFGDVFVGGCQAFPAIHHDHRDVSLIDRPN